MRILPAKRGPRVATLTLVAALALVAAGYGILHLPWFSALHVRVSGVSGTREREVLAVTGLGKKPPLISVSPSALEQRLKRIPWVGTAKVTRNWPDDVSVSVSVRQPVAQVSDGPGQAAVVDATGRILQRIAAPLGSLPVVQWHGVLGPPGAWISPVPKELLKFASDLGPQLAAVTASIYESSSGRIHAILRGPAGAVQAVVGRPVELSKKAMALNTVVTRVGLGNVNGRIDVSDPLSPTTGT
jgi:cell division protein FtsQ